MYYATKTTDFNEAVAQYLTQNKQEIESGLARVVYAYKNFIPRFPKDKIEKLPLDKYLIAPKGTGYDDTFCMGIKEDLKEMGHMGNVFPSTFGIYMKNGTQLTLSASLGKRFGSNFDGAYSYIKQQIKRLFNYYKNKQYDNIGKVDLNEAFKYRLLMVYYPLEVFPVSTKDTLKGYCDSIGVPYDEKEEPIYPNLRIVQLKQTLPNVLEWTNHQMMSFLDWLWRSHIRVITNQMEIQGLDDSHSEEEIKKHAASLGLDSLKKIAVKQSTETPKEVTASVKQIQRNIYISEYAKRRAAGICQLCGNKAPFNRADGEPYLESHHIIWLSEGGADSIDNTVALCPNCHRKMHVVNDPKDVNLLKAKSCERNIRKS